MSYCAPSQWLVAVFGQSRLPWYRSYRNQSRPKVTDYENLFRRHLPAFQLPVADHPLAGNE